MKTCNLITTFLVAMMLLAPSFSQAIVINVPEDFETIQAAIDESEDGDIVLVQPGEYFENININGRNISVGSLFIIDGDPGHIGETVIDGNENGNVVMIENTNGVGGAALNGFTITNGSANGFGGGLSCDESTFQSAIA